MTYYITWVAVCAGALVFWHTLNKFMEKQAGKK